MNKVEEVPSLKNTTIEELAEWFLRLKDQKLSLSEIGLTNKTFYDWRQQEVVPPSQLKKEEEKYKELKFSFFENIWLQIVKDLRQMGLSYQSIKNIRKNIWEILPYDMFVGSLDEFIEADNKVNPEYAAISRQSLDLLKEHGGKLPEEDLFISVFESIVLNSLLVRTETKLLFRYDGEFGMLHNIAPFVIPGESKLFDLQEHYNKEFAEYPHLIIPIAKYLKDFFYLGDSPKKLLSFNFITEDEYEVLKVIRAGDLKEITVKMNQTDNSIKGYEYKQDQDMPEDEFRKLTKSFFLKDYESVSFKRRDNKSIYFEKTVKKNMNK